MPGLSALLSAVFGKPEEINGHDRCPTYLYRWTVGGLFSWKVYVHRFVADDWCLDLHDHPKRFISIGLRGHYWEETKMPGKDRKTIKYAAPWLRTFPADHRHRISLPPGRDCWTLVIVGPKRREWGFWHDGIFRRWDEFVTSADADDMKACP